MTPTRLRTLFLIAAVLAVASWLLLKSVYGSLPSFPWTMVPALLIAAGGEAAAGEALPARAAGHDVFTGSLTFGASVLLAVAALYLEHCCRVPDDPDAARYSPPPPPPTD